MIVHPDSNRVHPGGAESPRPRPAARAEAWKQHAPALAAWANANMVNRRDAFGRYVAAESRKPGHDFFTAKEPLTPEILQVHFIGKSTGDLISLHSTAPPELTGGITPCLSRWLSIDLDRHHEETDPESTLKAALVLYGVAAGLGFSPLLFDSNGWGGYHLILLFDKPTETRKLYLFAKWLRRDWEALGLDADPETFPKQASIEPGRFGNLVRLPGRHHTRDHYTKVWDGLSWLEGSAAIKAITGTKGSPATLIPPEALVVPKPPPPRYKSDDFSGSDDVEQAGLALACLDPSMAYAEWVKVGMSLASLGQEGLALWDHWSAGCPEKYGEYQCERKWRTFRPDGRVGLGTLFHMAKQSSGFKQEKKKASRAKSKAKHEPAGPKIHDPGEDEPETTGISDHRFNLTDLGNAERLVARHGKDLRYCHVWKRWLVWDGRRWMIDNTGAPRRRARETVRAIYSEAGEPEGEDARKHLAKWAMESEKRDRISAMLNLAEPEPGIPILPEHMDLDRWAFNCSNGTIDLRTGELRPHRREDLITKICPTPYEADARCELWESTLDLFFAGNRELIDYFQAICGYAISGIVRDHILPIAYGRGSNGKSTMLGAIIDVFGPDYAMKCPPDMLMAKKTDSHPTDRADLFGKRLVVAIETESGRNLNETMVKELTGGDKIRARRMREDFWEFDPTHTLILATNHKPAIRGTDNGIWRRLKLIPFAVSLMQSNADTRMPEKLRAEFPGILAWCVRGCLLWQSAGFAEPAEVTEASSDYRKQQDLIGSFIEECVIFHGNFRVKAGELFKRYTRWCEYNNENPTTMMKFGMAMEEREIEKTKSSSVWYLGMQLKPETNSVPEPEPEQEPVF